MRQTIQIGPSRYRIRKHKWNAKVLAGSRGYHASNNVIGLELGMPKDMEAEVFMHEVLHGIWFTFGLDKIFDDDADQIEEFVVSNISTTLCTVFSQNPWLLDYLKKGLLTKSA